MLSEKFQNTIWNTYQAELSQRTKKEYLNVIKSFEKETSNDPCELTKEATEKYVSSLIAKVKKNNLSYTTALMRISVMRSLCNYIKYVKNKNGENYENYFCDIILPDEDKIIKNENLPSEIEINNLLEIIKEFNDDQFYIIVCLAIKCGLTTSELSKLDAEFLMLDIDKNLCINFPPSRNISRIIRLSNDISKMLDDYLSKNEIVSGPIFFNKRHTRMKVRDIERLLLFYINKGKEINKINKSFTFQDLRHCAFKYMLSGGATESEVAQYGGITPKWMTRYRQIVKKGMSLNAADYSIIEIKTHN